jgi:hypothetical protein
LSWFEGEVDRLSCHSRSSKNLCGDGTMMVLSDMNTGPAALL